jgi:SAM-dependent methyltransferase
MGNYRVWERYGAENPYFGVLTDERFRGKVLPDAVFREFFASGEADIERALSSIERHFFPLQRGKALDFGCGVGRLAIPLAARFSSVVGVDISPSMLQEAQKSARRMQIENLRLCQNLSEIAEERGTFSFVNTYIVLQHVGPKSGLGYISELIGFLGGGGCGALHMTYAREKYRSHLGAIPLLSRAVQMIRRPFSSLHREVTRREPAMQMNPYPLNQVLYLLQTAGVTEFHSEFTNHGGHLGLVLYFTKP